MLTLVPDGEELTVSSMKEYEDGWVQVKVDGGKGYVSADYVEISRQYAYAESRAEEEARIAAEEARIAAEESVLEVLFHRAAVLRHRAAAYPDHPAHPVHHPLQAQVRPAVHHPAVTVLPDRLS